jgi:branched-chain amino acid transport system permease protein
MDNYLISVLSNIGLISFIAVSAYLLLLAGEISFGQQAFFGIGAYASGIATAMWGWPLWAGLACGALMAAFAALLLAIPTVRLRGLYFSIATLAFAEMVRNAFLVFTYRVEVAGELVGPDAADGFRGIRYIFEQNISGQQYMLMIYVVLAVVIGTILVLERSRLGAIVRMTGQDPLLAEMQGVDVIRCKVMVASLAGLVAGTGGGMYAHLMTYVEPQNFNVMLGVHSLAYGLIGGLGTVLGPLIGVGIDIGFLESVQFIQGYRMIAFGGLVAVLLIVRPRGLLDETTVRLLSTFVWRRRRA